MGLRGVAFLFVLFASAGVADQGASRSFVASFSDQDPPESVARDADVSARTVTLADADKAIEVLRQKTKELTDAPVTIAASGPAMGERSQARMPTCPTDLPT